MKNTIVRLTASILRDGQTTTITVCSDDGLETIVFDTDVLSRAQIVNLLYGRSSKLELPGQIREAA